MAILFFPMKKKHFAGKKNLLDILKSIAQHQTHHVDPFDGLDDDDDFRIAFFLDTSSYSGIVVLT